MSAHTASAVTTLAVILCWVVLICTGHYVVALVIFMGLAALCALDELLSDD